MKDLSKRILESGLVDETTALMMEKWGVLEEGASDLTKKEELKNATREQLMKFADEVADKVDEDRRLRETMLDLNQLRWHVPVKLAAKDIGLFHVDPISALVDRMGRYYFRPQDVDRAWLVPGHLIVGQGMAGKDVVMLEVTDLFIGDQVAAIQVSTQ